MLTRSLTCGDTEAFTEKLHEATQGHFQLTTDGWRPYENAVAYSLGTRVDYAMLIKVCAKDREGEQKYSPPELEVEKLKLELEKLRLDLDIRKERTAKLQIVLPIAVSIIAIMVSSLNEWRRSREAAGGRRQKTMLRGEI